MAHALQDDICLLVLVVPQPHQDDVTLQAAVMTWVNIRVAHRHTLRQPGGQEKNNGWEVSYIHFT
jgi:hypothetical protein